jgi:hypothetical protein
MIEFEGPIHTVAAPLLTEATCPHRRGKTYYLSWSRAFPEENA